MFEVDLAREQEKSSSLRSEIHVLQESLDARNGQLSAFEEDACQNRKQLIREKELLFSRIRQLEDQINAAREESEMLRKLFTKREEENAKLLALTETKLSDASLSNDKANIEIQKLKTSLREAKEGCKTSDERAKLCSSLLDQGMKECADRTEELHRNMRDSSESIRRELNERIKVAEERALQVEQGEAATFKVVKELETKLCVCFVQHEENLANQRRTLLDDFKSENEDELKELLNRLHFVQEQRNTQEMQLDNLAKELSSLRKAHEIEIAAAQSTIANMRSELASALEEAGNERKISSGLRSDLTEVSYLLTGQSSPLEWQTVCLPFL